MTWELAPSGPLLLVSVSAGQPAVAAGVLSARAVAGLLVLAVAVLAAYLGSCIIWPYARCLACIGHSKRNPGSTSKRWGRCPICHGTAERLRIGTRLLRAAGYKHGRWPR